MECLCQALFHELGALQNKQRATQRLFRPTCHPIRLSILTSHSHQCSRARTKPSVALTVPSTHFLMPTSSWPCTYAKRPFLALNAQFETIQPFLDGNGRVGRLLITFLLVYRGILHQPLLYLSTFLKRHRAEYYDRLMAIRERGDWEGWLRFFLKGVAESAEEATPTARSLVRLRDEHRTLIQEHGLGMNGLRLLDLLYHVPLVNVRFVEEKLGVTYFTANKLTKEFEALRLLEEVTGAKRNRRYRYSMYLGLFDVAGAELVDGPYQTTETEYPVPAVQE